MGERLFGVETEYGLSVIPAGAAHRDHDRATREIFELARRFPHLPGRRSSGLFLGNGIADFTSLTVPSRRGSAAPRCDPVVRSMKTACTEPIVC